MRRLLSLPSRLKEAWFNRQTFTYEYAHNKLAQWGQTQEEIHLVNLKIVQIKDRETEESRVLAVLLSIEVFTDDENREMLEDIMALFASLKEHTIKNFPEIYEKLKENFRITESAIRTEKTQRSWEKQSTR